jgi:CRP-like cAMP-binding protein
MLEGSYFGEIEIILKLKREFYAVTDEECEM